MLQTKKGPGKGKYVYLSGDPDDSCKSNDSGESGNTVDFGDSGGHCKSLKSLPFENIVCVGYFKHLVFVFVFAFVFVFVFVYVFVIVISERKSCKTKYSAIFWSDEIIWTN